MNAIRVKHSCESFVLNRHLFSRDSDLTTTNISPLVPLTNCKIINNLYNGRPAGPLIINTYNRIVILINRV